MLLGVDRRILTWIVVGILICPPLVDFVTWSSWRQGLQRAADNASTYAADAMLHGRSPESGAFSHTAVVRLRLAAPPVLENPPRGGSYAGHAEAVRIRLVAERAPFFWSKLFGPARMTAVSTAALVPSASGPRVARIE
jgi:hypothetical protein